MREGWSFLLNSVTASAPPRRAVSWDSGLCMLLDAIISFVGWMFFGNTWPGVKSGCQRAFRVVMLVLICLCAHYVWALCWPVISLISALIMALVWFVRAIIRKLGTLVYWAQRAAGGVPEAADTEFIGPGTGRIPETADLRAFKKSGAADKWVLVKREVSEEFRGGHSFVADWGAFDLWQRGPEGRSSSRRCRRFDEIARAIKSQTAETASLVKSHTENTAVPPGTLKGLNRHSEELVFLLWACNQYQVVVGAGEEGQALANALLSAQVGASTNLRKAGFKQKVTTRLAVGLAGPYWGTQEKHSLTVADFIPHTLRSLTLSYKRSGPTSQAPTKSRLPQRASRIGRPGQGVRMMCGPWSMAWNGDR